MQIPLGTSKVHLGNFVCILAGLLCGGLVGGISGSLGMGLNDLLSGYGPDTYIRSFIVKFLLGFIAGALFRYLIKKEKKITYRFYFISGAAYGINRCNVWKTVLPFAHLQGHRNEDFSSIFTNR